MLEHVRAKQGKFVGELFEDVFVHISHEDQTRSEDRGLTVAMLRNDEVAEHMLDTPNGDLDHSHASGERFIVRKWRYALPASDGW